ncbi:MAG: hypothetical protein H6709_20825 [Kofleriaceae bacterium]|nr:hypothetical protein [Kofleriaceae bacterium]
MLSLPSAPTFDPRALHPTSLLSAFVSGALDATPGEAFAAGAAPAIGAARAPSRSLVTPPTTAALAGDVTVDSALAARAPARALVSPDRAAVPAGGAAATPATTSPGIASVRSSLLARRWASADAAAPASGAPSPSGAPSIASSGAPSGAPTGTPSLEAAAVAPSPGAPTATPSMAAGASPVVASPELALPGVGPLALHAPLRDVTGWSARPGQTAGRAHDLAVSRERAAADLSFDFVTPEMVLAAQVYGFGAVEAAQAARLAVEGPSSLSAMASAVDLTLLRGMDVADDVRATAARTSPSGVRPSDAPASLPSAALSSGALPSAVVPGTAPTSDAIAPNVAAPAAASPAAAALTSARAPLDAPPSPSQAEAPATSFGVGRRMPRGAFLWPAGAVAALGMRAQLPEGAATLPLAALEILAAGAVADMSTLVAPRRRDGDDGAAVGAPGVAPASRPGARLGAQAPALEVVAGAAAPTPIAGTGAAAADELAAADLGAPDIAAARADAPATAPTGVAAWSRPRPRRARPPSSPRRTACRRRSGRGSSRSTSPCRAAPRARRCRRRCARRGPLPWRRGPTEAATRRRRPRASAPSPRGRRCP